MRDKINIIGERYGRLVCLKEDKPHYSSGGIKSRMIVCLCDCGRRVSVLFGGLRNGRIKSCGCFKKEILLSINTTHGLCPRNNITPEYSAWTHMKSRCLDSNDKQYKNYGARGIKVCERWLQFENFWEDMGPRPSDKHSLDRWPNINGDYTPENCRWATTKEQSRGKRTNIWVEFGGIKMVAKDAASYFGISYQVFGYHLRRGRSVDFIIKSRATKNV
jgi:hypothetical protein